jgi:hypothetical protein
MKWLAGMNQSIFLEGGDDCFLGLLEERWNRS